MAGAPGGDAVDQLVQLCSTGLDVDGLRRGLRARLPNVLTVDAVFLAAVDPATMLFTSAVVDEPLREVAPAFLANELGGADVNRFAVLAETPGHVRSLDQATGGTRADSARYRELMAPLGLGDELRAALVADGRCWGALCLHRERAGAGFSARDITVLRRLVPHLGRALQRARVARSDGPPPRDPLPGPGVLLLGPTGDVLASTRDAELWWALLDPDGARRGDLPVAVRALVARPWTTSSPLDPRQVTLRAADRQWATVTASPMVDTDPPTVAVVFAAAAPETTTSALLMGYGLTPAQRRVTELVLRGRSTRQIVAELYLSEYTVQEYLRAVFDKVGVNSRRELVVALLPR